ncbi:MAG: GNAT superfamily N-acetyltransferase [Bradymonadia bacterium]|jgi:GNAT superfamily N-acetyltransferase
MAASEIRNSEHVAEFLLKEPEVNAYALGYLDAEYQERCHWVGDLREGDLVSLAMVYEGLTVPALFTAGRADGIRRLLKKLGSNLPERVTGHVPPEHRASVESVLRPVRPLKRVARMGLSADAFVDPGESDVVVDVLSHKDTGAILQLYSKWPDNLFEPFQLESGLYFGVRSGGTLACIAGIHNLSETFDVAAIGNLVTHPDHRGEGYARACTAALLRTVLSRVGRVTLDVQEDNEPAVRTYTRFGFTQRAEFFEGELRRR